MELRFRSIENNSGLMAEGDYEVYVNDCLETTTKNGYPCIKFDFVVRSDVEQKYHGKHIFKSFFRNDNDEWPIEKIGKYANSLGIAKDTEFLLEDLVGRNCIVHISYYTGNDGTERECIFYTAPSKAEPYMNQGSFGNAFAEVADEDGDFPF